MCQVCKLLIVPGQECDDEELRDVHKACYDDLSDKLEAASDNLAHVEDILKDLLDE